MAPNSNRILFWVHIKVVVCSASQQTFMSRELQMASLLSKHQCSVVTTTCSIYSSVYVCIFYNESPIVAQNETKVVMQMLNWKLKK